MISIATIGIICGMLGATAVAFERPFYANVLWLIGNPLLIIHNYGIGETGQSAMFAYYIFTALFGVVYHQYKRKTMTEQTHYSIDIETKNLTEKNENKTQVKEEHTTFVNKNVWGPGDTYLTVGCQVEESNFKPGGKVKLTIEKVNE